MQTVKTLLLFLAIFAGLTACGLKGPLYLPAEEPVAGTETPAQAEDADKDTQEKKKKDSGKG